MVLDGLQQYLDWEEAHRPCWSRQYIFGIYAHVNEFKAKPVTMKYLKELESARAQPTGVDFLP